MSEQIAPAAPEEKAPTRTSVLLRNPRRLIIAAILLLVAIGVAVFTTATFTSASASPGNMVAAGSVQIDNSHDGVAIFTASGLVPGDSVNGTVADLQCGQLGRQLLDESLERRRHPCHATVLGKARPAGRGRDERGQPADDLHREAERHGNDPAREVGRRRKAHVQVHDDVPERDSRRRQPVQERLDGVDFVWNVVS